jgi:thymidylate synthase (FAD)
MRNNVQAADEILNKYFPVLDFGFASLVDYMGSDESIEQAARVSYGQGTRKASDTRTLIRYLYNHKHTTPIEMVQLKFHISMPIHAHRQFIRHRMSTTNEYSARYSVVPEVYYDEYTMNIQSKNNKQGRGEDIVEGGDSLKQRIKENEQEAFALYKEAVDGGIAREISRMHLPLNSYTYFYWKIDLHNLLHFLKLRCDSHAQFEIRQFSNVLAGMVKRVAPLAFEAWEDYSFYSSNWTRLDKKLHNFIDTTYGDDECNTFVYTKDYEEVKTHAKSIGMSTREYDEFWTKLAIPEPQNFDLDLTTAKEASYFEQLVKDNT